MNNDGWIKIHRSLLEWEWYSDTNIVRLFLHLLLKANWKDKSWQGNLIKRGSFITSYSNLSIETNLSVQQIRTILDKLKSTNEITITATNKFTLVTLVKYNDYQIIEDESTSKITSNLTNEQQTNNKQITTTKEVKNITSKEKKILFKETVLLFQNEYDKLLDIYGNVDSLDKGLIILDNYKLSSGKKYKSDFHVMIGWVKDKFEKEKSSAKKENKSNPLYGRQSEQDVIDTIEIFSNAIENSLKK